jgi:predicted protein tyrosine phosphatase
MEFFVYSRGAVERIAPHEEPHAIISISSAPDDLARLPVNQATAGVLRLSFLDADQPSANTPQETLFSPAQAAQVWDFLSPRRNIARLVLHCDAGLSRSPAVAAAVSRVFCGDDADFFRRYSPNRLVYRRLLEEAVARGLWSPR